MVNLSISVLSNSKTRNFWAISVQAILDILSEKSMQLGKLLSYTNQIVSFTFDSKLQSEKAKKAAATDVFLSIGNGRVLSEPKLKLKAGFKREALCLHIVPVAWDPGLCRRSIDHTGSPKLLKESLQHIVDLDC